MRSPFSEVETTCTRIYLGVDARGSITHLECPYNLRDRASSTTEAMSDIIVAIRNEQGASMSSVDGALVVVLLASEGQVVDQQPVRMTVADVIFSRLPPGRYTVIARHPSLNPTEARQDVLLPEKLMLGVKYFYVEGERQLLRIELIERRLDV
jgi:hypothetical protein